MLELILLLCVAVTSSVTTRRYVIAKHRAKMLRDESRYKDRWTAAVELLHVNGQVSDEQFETLLGPSGSSTQDSQINFRQLYSEDRATLEIKRAKAGLPPVDNLNGMWAEDKARVLKARLRYQIEAK